SIIYYKSKLYVATTQGVFVQNQIQENTEIKSKEDVLRRIKRFTQIPGMSSQSWSLVKVTDDGNDKYLIAGTSDGVFEIDGENAKLISNYYTFSICRSNKNLDLFYLGTTNGVAVIKREADKWKDLGVLDGIQSAVRSIVEDKNGDIWMGIPFFEGVAKLSFNENSEGKKLLGKSYQVEVFDSTSGLADFRYNIVYALNNDILVATYKGLYRWDFEKERFFPEKRFGEIFSDGSRQVFCFTKGPENTYWFFNSNDKIKETGVVTLNSNKPIWYNTTFKRFSDNEIHVIYVTPDKRVWFGGPDGLIVYNSKLRKDYNKPFFNILSKVTIGKDSVIFHGNYVIEETGRITLTQKENDIPSLVYKLNSISFEFSSVSFEDEKNNRYKWFLEGYDNEWTNWTNESKVSYTNLPEGRYTFHLISKNIYDVESEKTIYSFIILPPWYRTVYAYIAYILLFVGFVYGAIQLSIYRLKRSKAQLELIVQERTAEIVQQKEEIEIQKELVEEKNKDITDSINYASRIQQAILPILDEIKKVLPESFVFYRPRDIVSGDFYWFVTKGKDVYIAAADCTGHGVPGAFMSMIGHTLLNEILNQKNITSTGDILTELHKQIRISLKQDQQESRDGMDIALCKINLETLILQYSGAMRPLYLIINGELIEIKADKFPIGGLQDNDEKRVFKSNEIQLKKGDLFYIFSDGYADQFGGKEGKKFMIKRLKELLLQVAPYDMNYQYNQIVNNYIEWLGDGEQIDDILFIGVRV
ncbi:MAG: SpoIIE family protein phosphatase, partial [Bacteroidia bacterium]